ncbi:hypothetical protein [Paraburkholderia phenoliruptrix]|uniref:hypothetical protein n=1 Tax=Paraburkholderia phenoliruptrix TaxID=252970 RepID=UPI00286999D9|nr:hypothetical protein [Paraburkholderia phenoliruptrix]WMY10093.1 hypothetical protein P3F88_07545 [Paraburkholderia phenoliruptrix]
MPSSSGCPVPRDRSGQCEAPNSAPRGGNPAAALSQAVQRPSLDAGNTDPLASIPDEDELLNTLPQFQMVEMERDTRPPIQDLREFTKLSAKAQDREGIAFLILSNKYVGFLPAHYADRWVAANQMKALARNRLEYTINYRIIARRSSQPHQLTKLFLDELQKGPLVSPDGSSRPRCDKGG